MAYMSKIPNIYYILALIPSFMGSVSYVLSKYVINDISPITLLFYRWFVAFIVLTPFAIRAFINEFTIIRANLGILTVISIFGVTLFNLFCKSSNTYETF